MLRRTLPTAPVASGSSARSKMRNLIATTSRHMRSPSTYLSRPYDMQQATYNTQNALRNATPNTQHATEGALRAVVLLGKARQGKARQGKARQGKARQGKATQKHSTDTCTQAPSASTRRPPFPRADLASTPWLFSTQRCTASERIRVRTVRIRSAHKDKGTNSPHNESA
jgi:hypothetical protein